MVAGTTGKASLDLPALAQRLRSTSYDDQEHGHAVV